MAASLHLTSTKMMFAILLSSGNWLTDWIASRFFTGPMTRYLLAAAVMLLLADALCIAISLAALVHSHDPRRPALRDALRKP
jgi:hypothetical protein